LWRSDRPLKKQDFKGKIIHENAVASTVYCIHKEIKGKNGALSVSIKTYFLFRQFLILKSSIGNNVMVHEQKHFDIAEMFAMKLRKQLRQIVVKDGVDAKFKLDSLYKIISLEMDLYQDTYDNETDHI